MAVQMNQLAKKTVVELDSVGQSAMLDIVDLLSGILLDSLTVVTLK